MTKRKLKQKSVLEIIFPEKLLRSRYFVHHLALKDPGVNCFPLFCQESARVALCAVGGDVEKAMRLVLEDSLNILF